MNSRCLIISVALAATAICRGQTHLAVSRGGHPAGFATLDQRIDKEGSKIVALRMELVSGKRHVRLTSEAKYNAKGMPMRKFQEAIIPGGVLTQQIIATFDKDGANVVLLDSEKRTTKHVSLASSAPRANLSEFWFIRDTPKAGQVEETYQFNPDSIAWELVHTEFRGKKTLKIEGHTVTVNEVVTERSGKETTSYLDQQGLPVLVDQGDVKMVKIWPK